MHLFGKIPKLWIFIFLPGLLLFIFSPLSSTASTALVDNNVSATGEIKFGYNNTEYVAGATLQNVSGVDETIVASDAIQVMVWKQGSPTDGVQLILVECTYLCSDQVVLDTSDTVSSASLPSASGTYVSFIFPNPISYTLSDHKVFGIFAKRTDANSDIDYYKIATDSSDYDLAGWDGSNLGCNTTGSNCSSIGNAFIPLRTLLNESCYDGIQNQNETGVDVGGVCEIITYSNLQADSLESIHSSFNRSVQTLGTNLTGTLTKIDIKTSNPTFGLYGSRPLLSLYECNDDTYGSPILNGSGCDLVYSGTSDDSSKLEASVQSFFTGPIVLDPLKYYFFFSSGNNIFNTLPVYYGSAEDTVDGTCYQYQLGASVSVAPCATISDLYFSFYGVSKVTSPPSPQCVTDCFSNVLFLPGIKGSILKNGSDTLWPPTIFSLNDVSELALDENGESVNDIYTDGVLDNFYTAPIYAPFSDFMDGLTGEDNLINDWLPLAYDWRFLPDKIIENGIKTESGVLDVIEEIETLAENSKTGKVTIVSHSMGGLLGKAIIKKLEDEGKDNLIDSFVMVGTPQLGTPQAVATILHGDDEGILAGFITNPIRMRAVAQNMPSAYSLILSPEYFNEVADPVVTFNENSSFTQTWRDFWGPALDTYSSFSQFMTGEGVARVKPTEQDLQRPEVLSSELMQSVADFHNEYDNYQFPEHIRVVQVAGWGRPTTKAIEYINHHGIPSYKTIPTVEGDKTVIYASAVSSVVDETYFFNLDLYREPDNKMAQHRDLLNTIPIKNIVESLIKNESILEFNFITNTKPQVVNLEDQLIVSTHSPVILGVYDQLGNFTGIDPEQDLSADIFSVKEDILGSTFSYSGESQSIFLPKEGNYDFVYKGIGNGPTTVTIEDFVADVVSPIASYTDIPTTANTSANFTVQSSAPEDTEIALDTDSDGENNEVIYPDGYIFSLNELLVLIKGKISSLIATDKVKQDLLKKISGLEKKIESKKEKNQKVLSGLENKISKLEIKGKIDSLSAGNIVYLLDLLEAQSESTAFDSATLTDLKTKIQSLNVKTGLKNELLKRVEKLEKKQALIKALSNLSDNIMRKAGKNKITDADAQTLINLIIQIESVI